MVHTVKEDGSHGIKSHTRVRAHYRREKNAGYQRIPLLRTFHFRNKKQPEKAQKKNGLTFLKVGFVLKKAGFTF